MKYLLLILLFFFLNQEIFAQIRERDSLIWQLSVAKDDTTKIDLYGKIALTYAFAFQDTAIMYADSGLNLAGETGFDRGKSTLSLCIKFCCEWFE